MRRMCVFACWFVVAVVIAMSPAGCMVYVSAPANGLAPSHERSYVRASEEVTLRLIRWSEWDEFSKDLDIKIPARLERIPTPSGADRLFGVPEAASMAVGLIVDVIKTELEKEAAKHEQQFSQSLYGTDFWEDVGVPRYAAFEIVRRAAGFSGDTPAFRMIVAIVPSEHERRLFLLQPVYLRVAAAAAKVSAGDTGERRVNIQTNVVLQSAVVTKENKLIQENVADATFVLGGYSLDKSPILTASWDKEKMKWKGTGLENRTAGYFLAPLPSQGGPAGWFNADKGGAFRLFAAVTEKDESRVKAILLKFAEFVGTQRPEIVNEVKERVKEKMDGPPPPGGR